MLGLLIKSKLKNVIIHLITNRSKKTRPLLRNRYKVVHSDRHYRVIIDNRCYPYIIMTNCHCKDSI